MTTARDSKENIESNYQVVIRKLLFRKQDEGESRLILFWETAQPLKRVLEDLPDIGEGSPMAMTLTAVARRPSGSPVLEVMASKISILLPNLPEPLFERLALRFRPFYVQEERTFFLGLLTLLADRNEDLRAETKRWKERWNRAVFLGAMEMPEATPRISAELVIKTGFYSRYFHVNAETRERVAEYERSIGKEMFRAALVTAVWQRARLVVALADEVEKYLLDTMLLPEDAATAARDLYRNQPEILRLDLKGGPGSVAFKEVV